MTLQLSKISNTITVIESQILAIESSEWSSSIVEALRASTNAMKKMNNGVSVNDIEDIVSDMEHQLDNANEVTKLLSATDMPGISNSMTNSLTDMDLDEELDALLFDEGDVQEPHKGGRAVKKGVSNSVEGGESKEQAEVMSPPTMDVKTLGGVGVKKSQKKETPPSLFTHLIPAKVVEVDEDTASGMLQTM